MINEIILTHLGLSSKEAKLYLASLEAGTASAQTIAQKAQIKRTTAYSVLETLAEKGFVLKTQKNGIIKFIAESPRSVSEKLKAYQKSFENNLPEMEAIYNKKQIKPKILFFEGREGLLKVYEDTLKEKPQEILEFNTSEIFKAFDTFHLDYVEERIKRNIHAQRIAPRDKLYLEHAKSDEKELSETKLVKDLDIPIEINIYNDKVAFVSYTDKIGLIIESEGIAKSMKKIYQLLWDKLD